MPLKCFIHKDEAKSLACPMRLHDTGLRHELTRCLADRCMAWRFVWTHVILPKEEKDLVPDGETYGYCGLAGKPGEK
jgi:hypothetical protein